MIHTSSLTRFGASALCLGFLSVAANGQSFVDAAANIPGGAPFNASFTENVEFADVDADGDFDVAFPDGGDCCNDQNRIWINMGGLQAGTIGFFSDETATRFPVLMDDSRDIDFVDLDADGDQDLYTSNTSQISNQPNHFLVNMGGVQAGVPGFFQDQTASHWVNVGSGGSSVANSLVLGGGGFIDWSCDCIFADLDDDGDIDLVHSSYGGTFAGDVPSRLFLNDGNGGMEEFNPSGVQLAGATIPDGTPGLWAEGVHQSATTDATGAECDIADTPLGVEVGDLDGDYDLDILHGARNEFPRLFLNRLEETGGTLSLRDTTHSSLTQIATGPINYEQELGDLDQDGDLDIYGVNWDFLDDVVLLNDGAGTFSNFAIVEDSTLDDNEPDFFDFNNDGRLDVFVSAFSTKDRLYQGDGAPDWGLSNVSATQLPAGLGTGSLGSDAADVDGDGDYDLLSGRDVNLPNVLLMNVTQTPDTRAPYLPNLEKAPDRTPSATPTRVRVHVYDNTSWTAPQFYPTTLEYRVDGGAVTSVPMTFAGGQVFRGEIPGSLTGLVTYQVTSTDGSGNVGASTVLGYLAGASCSTAPSTYCTSKATSIPGCVPSLGFTGSSSATAGSGFTISAGPVPGGNPGLFVYTTQGPAASPLSTPYGFLCVTPGPGLFRIAFQPGGGSVGVCDGQYAVDFNAHMATQMGDLDLFVGVEVDLQAWYRDPANVGAANLTEAGRFFICP